MSQLVADACDVRTATGREPLRLLCFPYAGGGASVFRGWSQRLPSEIELCAVQLPGRETRLREPPLSSLPRLVDLLCEETAILRAGRYALFGHSVGALVAFELTRALRRRGERLPVQLFVSGCRAPQLADEEPSSAQLEDDALLAVLRGFDGTPEAVLRDRELLELLLPTLRADLGLRDGYDYRDEPALPIPITALGGEDDEHVPLSSLFAWRTHTARSFALQRFPGAHFYFREQPAFFERLGSSLERLTRRGRGPRKPEQEKRDGTRD